MADHRRLLSVACPDELRRPADCGIVVASGRTSADRRTFVLIATWVPSVLLMGSHPERSAPRRRFVILGGVVGLINMTVGATGPLIAPFFLNLGLKRQGIIGTKAASQALGHLVKIAVFADRGFRLLGLRADAAAPLSAMVVAGTWAGSQVLESVNELWFKRLFKTVLTLVALRLVILEGLNLLGA